MIFAPPCSIASPARSFCSIQKSWFQQLVANLMNPGSDAIERLQRTNTAVQNSRPGTMWRRSSVQIKTVQAQW